MFRNLSRTTLETGSYSVLTAADGQEALDLANAYPGYIDLLLTGIQMPRISGLSAWQHLSSRLPNLKVLFLSNGDSGRFDLPPSLPSLAKPVKPAALLLTVNRLPAQPAPAANILKIILVVDHNLARGERTKNILVNDSYAVITAHSVEEAEALSDTVENIDLVVGGVVFPGQSGVHLAEHFEASGRDISTLLVSHFHPDLLRSTVGFSRQPEFLPNPFTPEALLTRVRRLLES